MPTAMHPWMDPARAELWPHGTRAIYEAFDRIFACNGHGWSNLQSAHLNLPFAGDEEFARLHAAVRFLLPILPGLAASSPIFDGERNGILDNRLVVYRGNYARIPSITGDVVPEAVGSIGEYHETLLEPLYHDLAPFDRTACCGTSGSTRAGRSRASSGSPSRSACSTSRRRRGVDVAYVLLIVEVLKLLCDEQWSDLPALGSWRTADLATLLKLTERRAEDAAIAERRYLARARVET